MKQRKAWANRPLPWPILFGILFLSFNLSAQDFRVNGKVTSAEDGLGLPGVNILVKGTTNGAVTDIDGNYEISVPDGSAVLVFSYIGYSGQEIEVGSRNTIDIDLSPDARALEEVVVVGYGTVKKSDLTGSVVSLKSDDLTPGANVSMEQMLQGRAPGVLISQETGEPGAAMSITIRGASSITAGNDPLYVIDGMPVNNGAVISGTGSGFVANNNPRNPLNSLNPNDIASIEILKDASATAIYGSRGANGVVLITTKNGQEGRMKVSYNGYYGTQTVANQVDVLTATEYRDVLNAIIADGGGNAGEEVTDIQGDGTDWQSELFRDAPIQNHNISFSGGNNINKYYVSLDYFDQQGVVRYSGMKRYTARVNLDTKVKERYAFGINLNTSFIQDDYVSNGTGLNENAGALYSAINFDPTISVFDAAGNYNLSPFITTDNPLALALGEDALSESFRTFGTIYGEYFILPSLSAKVKLGGDINSSRRDVWIDPITVTGGQNSGIATIITGRRDYYLTEGTLNFNKAFGDQSLNAVVGATYEYFGSESFNGNGRGYALPQLTTNAIGSGSAEMNILGSGRNLSKLVSYLARVNYSIADKYLITASFRADGSSRFGPNNRFGFFPSAAFAWKLHNEAFMENDQLFSQLKFRASYGVIGNQSIPNYRFLPSFDTGADVVLNDSRFTTIQPSRNANPDLKWESTAQLDIGIDFGLWEDRLYGSVEYFDAKTTDLLLNVPKPNSTGFGSRTENVGSIRNTGIEAILTARVVDTRNFDWTTSANFTAIRNEVLDIGDAERIITGGLGFVSDATITRPGDPLYSYYGYEVAGVWQENDNFDLTTDNVAPGDLKYVDQNGDGTINADDQVILGNTFPEYTWGWTNTITFKGLSLSAFIQGVEGVSLLNNNLVDTYFPINFRRNKMAEPYLNRWTPSNPTNEYPSFVNPTAQGQRVVNSRTVTDASYIRLQSLRLGYTFPMANVKAISNLNVYVSANNLLTITDYIGTDPGANATGSSVLRIDYNTYPFARTFLVGLNVSF
ncbi:SusC/RagA family TonB-linked outer membrane protein [Flavilitoribacter nigricans]|uniref:SusC/RagA family TonB-linked outer membrane protein n=1 Tax=Flavilitoribacter nigricans (strain ATCC 23147 / DSM 23189 / NBRC 102662 / NCIMB 1420 / SS-2) TaxID=1122177 RepID=A0A2D0NBF3_FLAN2|nr:TonB-dependent receptor [Flavilitoribacter nigricans]PHN05690.1 SusC/RagA family TonB-linked outer membrane protein [Flavilitoribacter nigricans DSM 23189 = NBRC 102662]